MLKVMMIAGAGGFLGTVARFVTGRMVNAWFPSSFPMGTFTVNMAGCLLIGLFYGFAEKSDVMTAEWRLFLMVGFCGGFTTFSAFAAENLAMLRDSDYFHFFAYSGGSVLIGLAATFAGLMLSKLL